MRITISKCYACKKNRLVDRIDEKWICFACKQKLHMSHRPKPLTEFAVINN
ncbi:MAG: hypothetical protein QXD48_02120 [Candidatus Aenigmatarchaeota archaeon]